jgi:hypothetical protein
LRANSGLRRAGRDFLVSSRSRSILYAGATVSSLRQLHLLKERFEARIAVQTVEQWVDLHIG